MYKFKFADIGEGLHEGKVGEIFVKENQQINEGDSLFSVETDKVTSDIPAPVSGKILKILIKEGETVHVGDEIFHFDAPENESSKTTEEVKDENVVPKEQVTKNEQVELPKKPIINKPNIGLETPSKTTSFKKGIKEQDHILTTPLARALAKQKNIDITLVKGSGYNNRVLVKDVENFNSQPSIQPPTKTPIVYQPGQQTKVPLTPIRKAIAKAMTNSWQNVAYSNLVTEVDVTMLWDQRKNVLINEKMIEKLGIKLSILPFIIKATAKALHKYPFMNAKLDQDLANLVYYSDKNIGIAVDAPQGLLVPVIKNADQKSLVDIAQEIKTLAIKARTKKISLPEMTGGTFSITNFGSIGAAWGVPVINYPELAIMGVGVIDNKLKLNQTGQIINAKVMHLTIAFDHRFIDGADAGRFSQEVKKILENPILLMEDFNV